MLPPARWQISTTGPILRTYSSGTTVSTTITQTRIDDFSFSSLDMISPPLNTPLVVPRREAGWKGMPAGRLAAGLVGWGEQPQGGRHATPPRPAPAPRPERDGRPTGRPRVTGRKLT